MTEGYMKNEPKTARSSDTPDPMLQSIVGLGGRTPSDTVRKLQPDADLFKNGVCYEALSVYGCPFPFLHRSI